MPLLKGKAHILSEIKPYSLPPDTLLFHIPITGEAVFDYSAYLERTALYRKRVWSCRFTGRKSLTWEKARDVEQNAATSVTQLPETTLSQIAHLVHGASGRLDDIARMVSDAFRPKMPKDALAKVPLDPEPSPKLKCSASKLCTDASGISDTPMCDSRSGPPSSDENHDPHAGSTWPGLATQSGAEGSGGKAASASKSAPNRTVRSLVPLPLARAFVVTHASPWQGQLPAGCQQLWVLSEELCARFGLQHDPTQAQIERCAAGKKIRDKSMQTNDNLGASRDMSPPLNVGQRSVAPFLSCLKPEHVPVPKTREEVEAQYKEGSIKFYASRIMGASGSEALSLADIASRAEQMGYPAFTSNQKSNGLLKAISLDPNFVRVTKGRYALHCFYPGLVPCVKAGKEGGRAGRVSETAKQAALQAPEAPIDSIEKAEQLVAFTEQAQQQSLADVKAAELAWVEAKMALSQTRKAGSPVRRLGETPVATAAELARFELQAWDRAYQGHPDDRKALLEHRQALQARTRELEATKQAFLKEKEAARAAETAQEGAAFRAADRSRNRARKAAEAAEKAASQALTRLSQLRERERRQRDGRGARRCAVDDLELLEDLRREAALLGRHPPPADVALPVGSALSPDGGRRWADCAFVADLVSAFPRVFRAQKVSGAELAAALGLTEGWGGGDFASAKLPALAVKDVLGPLYLRLVRLVLDAGGEEDGPPGSIHLDLWRRVLHAGTWPQVLSRLLLARAPDAAAHPRVDGGILTAARALARVPPEALAGAAHLALLRWLADAALDSAAARRALRARCEAAEEVRRELREGAAEARRAREGERDGRGRAAGDEEEEPGVELPAELVAYAGDPEDRRAYKAFVKRQAEACRQLRAERRRWEEARAAEKEADGAAEKRAEALGRARAEGEARLERLVLRREPLGRDRRCRSYWWGLGGRRDALVVLDAAGKEWTLLERVEEVEALLESLDARGAREGALRQALERRMPALLAAMRSRRSGEERRDRAKPRHAAARASTRAAARVEVYDAAAQAAAEAEAPRSAGLALLLPSSLQAFEACFQNLATLVAAAAQGGWQDPRGASWCALRAELEEARRGRLPGGKGDELDSELLEARAVAYARSTLVRAEHALLLAALAAERWAEGVAEPRGRGEETSSDENGECRGVEELVETSISSSSFSSPSSSSSSDSDEATSLLARSKKLRARRDVEEADSKRRLFDQCRVASRGWRRLWRSTRERRAWQRDVASSHSLGGVAYVAAVLARQAEPLLCSVGTHGDISATSEASVEEEVGGEDAALRIRAARAAVLELGAGVKAGPGKKRRLQPLPVATRVTRTRAA